jgi:hypothetical protein
VSVVGVTFSISSARLRRALLATRFAGEEDDYGPKERDGGEDGAVPVASGPAGAGRFNAGGHDDDDGYQPQHGMPGEVADLPADQGRQARETAVRGPATESTAVMSG